MALAFFLGVLHGYAPPSGGLAPELTALRDRVAGIMLGNLLMSVVFSTLWPVSALDRARILVAQAVRALSQLMRDAANPKPAARLTAVQQLTQARHFASIARFESDILAGRGTSKGPLTHAVAHLERLATAVFVVAGQAHGRDAGETVHAQDAATSIWLDATADRFSAGESAPPAPDGAPIADALAVLPADAPPFLRATIESRAVLQTEIERVASSAA